MKLRERLLKKMDLRQRVFFGCVLGVSIVMNVSAELYITGRYKFNYIHIAMVVGLILLISNPKGIRLALGAFFAYLMFKLLAAPLLSYGHSFDRSLFLYGYPMYLIGFTNIMNAYIHAGFYAILAFLVFKNPFQRKVQSDSEVIDRFDQE